MMLWKQGLKWLEMGVVVGGTGLVKSCEGAGCKLRCGHVPKQYHFCRKSPVGVTLPALTSVPPRLVLPALGSPIASWWASPPSLQDCAPQWEGLCPL